jgi:hypothetical protein
MPPGVAADRPRPQWKPTWNGAKLTVEKLKKQFAPGLVTQVEVIALLGPTLGALCDSMARDAVTPWAVCAMVFLAVLAGLMGPKASISPGAPTPAWKENVLLWTAVIAPTGAGKTPSMKPIEAALQDSQRLVNGIVSGGKSIPAGSEITFIYHSKTQEHLIMDLLSTDDYTKIAVNDELTAFLAGLGQYKQGGGSDAAMLLTFKSGGPLRQSTVGQGKLPVIVPMSHIAITGGIQPSNYEAHIGDAKSAASGREGRFLPIFAPLTAKNPGQRAPTTAGPCRTRSCITSLHA